MEMKFEIVGEDSRLQGVVKVRVPGIYGSKGSPLPARMAKLVRPAAESLAKVFEDIVAEGGRLYLSDMFRSANEQQRAHEDWKSGRKSAYSPPACASVHEGGRAIDIDAFDTVIGHKRVREILNKHGWTNIVETLTGAECWHYEFREARWEAYKSTHGYAAMAHALKEEIGNRAQHTQAERRKEEVRWLQTSLNRILGLDLEVDGIYGEATRAAVREFQGRHHLQIDGVAGPITRAKMEEVLSHG